MNPPSRTEGLFRTYSLPQDGAMDRCPDCKQELVGIDHYGKRLIGCIDCNRWSWQGSKRLFMELPDEDLHALRDRLR
jgi:hypothetical protein